MEDVEKFLRCLMSKGVLAMEILNGEGAEAFRHIFFSLSRKKQCHVFVSGG